jgi:hypothetical protein
MTPIIYHLSVSRVQPRIENVLVISETVPQSPARRKKWAAAGFCPPSGRPSPRLEGDPEAAATTAAATVRRRSGTRPASPRTATVKPAAE